MGNMVKGLGRLALWLGALLLLLAGGLRMTVVTTGTIDHDGMAPTLLAGDQLLVWRGPQPQGYIAYCTHPVVPEQFAVARVLAKEGARIAVQRKQLQINGKAPMTDWGEQESFTGHNAVEAIPVIRAIETLGGIAHALYLRKGATVAIPAQTIPQGELYLLSDNRTFARRDSRNFGTVPETKCVGTVFFRWRIEASPNNPARSLFGFAR